MGYNFSTFEFLIQKNCMLKLYINLVNKKISKPKQYFYYKSPQYEIERGEGQKTKICACLTKRIIQLKVTFLRNNTIVSLFHGFIECGCSLFLYSSTQNSNLVCHLLVIFIYLLANSIPLAICALRSGIILSNHPCS